MATVENDMAAIDPEAFADLEQVARLAAAGGMVSDPELLRRVTERARNAREEIYRRNGLLDIGVGLIREIRETQ